MDYVEGNTAYEETIENTGKQIAEICHKLHQIDPQPLIQQYIELDIPETRYKGLDWREEYIEEHARWLRPALTWVNYNYPASRVKPCICHGEFHPLNVIFKDGKVVSVLDWSTFKIEDYHYDLANLRNLSYLMVPVYYPEYDWSRFFSDFLGEYKRLGGFDEDRYEYFTAYLCFLMYTVGLRYRNAINHPKIMEKLSNTFEESTNIPLHKE